MSIHTDQHTSRFSEGMEQVPPLAASERVGCFADGMAMTAIGRVGTYADGLALRPDAPAARRVGNYGDTAPPARTAWRRRLRLGRSLAQPA
jgi:hypothetical protein